MHNTDQLVRQIVHLVRNRGYLAPDHAMAVAGNILDARPLPDAFAVLAPALIRHAALFDPFDREKIRLAADVGSRVPHSPFMEWLEKAKTLNNMEPVPDNIPVPDTSASPPSAFVDYLKAQPANISSFAILLHLWQIGAREEFLQAVQIVSTSKSGFLAAPAMAWGAHAAGEDELATMLLDEGIPNFQAHNLRARLALSRGNEAAAKQHLLDSLEAEPFQPALIEMLAEMAIDTLEPSIQHVHICLYSWNKPELLAQTIGSLATTDIDNARITILNNGTTDCSPKELESLVRKAAPNLKVAWIHLPINIGAPAARNWLLSQPEVLKSRYVAFLDDDVILPRHWLKRYIATLERYPKAAAVGPKCVNQTMRTVQYAFRNFEEIGDNKIRFTANAPALTDMGQFDAARPSLTVMGCCHLFHMERMKALGVLDFDIRFSPSQVDDIEHDLQIWKAGGQVIYDGGVQVIHLQDTGQAQSSAAVGQAYANHYKMERKYDLTELQAMDVAVHEADELHFSQALRAILPSLPHAPRDFWLTLVPHFP